MKEAWQLWKWPQERACHHTWGVDTSFRCCQHYCIQGSNGKGYRELSTMWTCASDASRGLPLDYNRWGVGGGVTVWGWSTGCWGVHLGPIKVTQVFYMKSGTFVLERPFFDNSTLVPLKPQMLEFQSEIFFFYLCKLTEQECLTAWWHHGPLYPCTLIVPVIVLAFAIFVLFVLANMYKVITPPTAGLACLLQQTQLFGYWKEDVCFFSGSHPNMARVSCYYKELL